jgi:hypothetical protein
MVPQVIALSAKHAVMTAEIEERISGCAIPGQRDKGDSMISRTTIAAIVRFGCQ